MFILKSYIIVTKKDCTHMKCWITSLSLISSFTFFFDLKILLQDKAVPIVIIKNEDDTQDYQQSLCDSGIVHSD